METRYDAGVGNVGSVLCRPPSSSWRIQNIANQKYDILCLSIQGNSHYTCGEKRFTTSPGSLLFFPKGVEHSAYSEPSNPWSFYSILFELLPVSEESKNAFCDIGPHLKVSNLAQIRSRFHELERCWIGREPGYMMRVRGIILELLHELVLTHIRHSGRILHASKINDILTILQECSGTTYGCEELAQMAELSPSRFRVLFKQMTGYSPTHYQNLIRMHRARDLLLSGGYTVTTAAAETGFEDVYYFSRLFKRLVGVSPSYYRNI